MEELLKKISEIYIQKGIKSVTMDDLAHELGVSKKTLYVHFKDREEVVDKVFLYLIQDHRCNIELIEIQNNNAIDKLLEVSKFLNSHIQKLHPSINYDLMKYYPKTWAKFISYKNDHIYNKIKANIAKGIEEGLYRSDFNIEIIAKLYNRFMELPIDNEITLKQDVTIDEIFKNLFIYHIRGIASQKGIDYLESKI